MASFAPLVGVAYVMNVDMPRCVGRCVRGVFCHAASRAPHVLAQRGDITHERVTPNNASVLGTVLILELSAFDRAMNLAILETQLAIHPLSARYPGLASVARVRIEGSCKRLPRMKTHRRGHLLVLRVVPRWETTFDQKPISTVQMS